MKGLLLTVLKIHLGPHSLSGGVDSVTALAIMPDETVSFFLDRCKKRFTIRQRCRVCKLPRAQGIGIQCSDDRD